MTHVQRTEYLLLPVIVLAGCHSSPSSLTAIAAGGTALPVEERRGESSAPVLPRADQQMLNQLQQEDPAFRAHYQRHYEDTGYSFNQYRPAYYYGYELSSGDRFESTDWSDVREQVRRLWDNSRLGLWTRYRDAVRFGWERGVDSQEG